MEPSEAINKTAAVASGDVAASGEWIASLLERLRTPSEDKLPGAFDRCLYDYERALLRLLCVDIALEEIDLPRADRDEGAILADAQLFAQHTEAALDYVKARTRLRGTLKTMRACPGLQPEV